MRIGARTWEVEAGEDQAAEWVVQAEVDVVGHVDAEDALVLDGRVGQADHGHLTGHTHRIQDQEGRETQPCEPVVGRPPFLQAAGILRPTKRGKFCDGQPDGHCSLFSNREKERGGGAWLVSFYQLTIETRSRPDPPKM